MPLTYRYRQVDNAMDFLANSITRRLNAIVIPSILAGLVGVTIAIGYYNHKKTLRELDQFSDYSLQFLSVSLDNILWNYNLDGLRGITDALLTDKKVVALLVYAEGDNQPLIQQQREPVMDLSLEAIRARDDIIYKSSDILHEGRKKIGTVHLAVSTASATEQIKSSTLILSILAVVLIALLSAIVAIAVAKVIAAPIAALALNARSLAAGNLSIEVDTRRGDEIGDLAGAFASMRDAIRQRLHDLRVLNSVGEELAATHDRDSALQITLRAMAEKFCADFAAVYQYDAAAAVYQRVGLHMQVDACALLPGHIEAQDPQLAPLIAVGDVAFISDYRVQINSDTPLQTLALICIPMLAKDHANTVILCAGGQSNVVFTQEDADFVAAIARACLTALKNIAMLRVIEEQNQTLEERIAERTLELQDAQKQLVQAAREAGMAEIAIEVLHNVGNTLNSVVVSAATIENILRRTVLAKLKRINDLAREHQHDMEKFLSADPQGKKLFPFYFKLETELQREQQQLLRETEVLSKSTDAIRIIIEQQQKHAKACSIDEEVSLTEVMDEALFLMDASLKNHGIAISTHYQSVEMILVQKSKLVHIFYNLLINAKDALKASDVKDRRIVISIDKQDEKIRVAITDNGIGIAAENLQKIFAHGFTTRKDGRGFGLHSCANYMNEMRGSIYAQSEGVGKGATFYLLFENAKAKSVNKRNLKSGGF